MGLKWSEGQVKAQDRGQWRSLIAALSLPGWRGWVSEFSPFKCWKCKWEWIVKSKPLHDPWLNFSQPPRKKKTKIPYLNTLPHIWLPKLNKKVAFLISSKKENRICMTLKSNVKKGVSLSIHYLGSLFQTFRSCGRRKQMWAEKKKTAMGLSLTSRPISLSQRLDSGRLIFG